MQQDGITDGECHNRGVVWDTPMTKWAGNENWIMKMAKDQPGRKNLPCGS